MIGFMILPIISVNTLYIKWCVQLNFNILNIDISNTMDMSKWVGSSNLCFLMFFNIYIYFKYFDISSFFYRVWDSKIFCMIINGIIMNRNWWCLVAQKSRKSLVIGTNISKIYMYMTLNYCRKILWTPDIHWLYLWIKTEVKSHRNKFCISETKLE